MKSFQYMINKLPKDIVQALKDTKQNPKWHPEQSVYKHLWMMHDSIWKSELLEEKKIILSICTIFHDTGKINCTREKILKDGSKALISYGHEDYAEKYLDEYLILFKEFIEPYHKEIFYYICKNHMRMHLYKNGKMSNPNKRKELENHEYFNLLKEFSKFDHGYDKIPIFIMTVGIPGSSKSTWTKYYSSSYCSATNKLWNIVCPDQIRKELTGDISNISQDAKVWKIAKERVIKTLSEGKNCILDSTMTKSKARRDFIKDLPLCYRFAKVFECDPEAAKERIKKDIENKVDRSRVPEEIVDRMQENFLKDKHLINEDGFEILE